MKKKFLIFAILFGIGGIGMFFLKDEFIPPQPEKPLSIEKKEITEENREVRFAIKASYPVFLGMADQKTQQSLNDLVKQKVVKQIKNFKDGVSNMDLSLVPQEYTSDLLIAYETIQSTTNLVSINFTVSEYWAGAAHPNSIANTFNYDLVKKRELVLDDVFKKDSDYLHVLSNISVEILMNRLGKELEETDDATFMKDWIKTGAGPKKENFSNFLLGKENFIIIFDPYQVGPYAWGFQKVEIPYVEIKNVLRIFPPRF